MQQRPPGRAGTPPPRSPRSGAPSGGSRRPRGSARRGFRVGDRVLLASALVVIVVSLVIFAALIVSGASRLGGDDDTEVDQTSLGTGLLAGSAGTPAPTSAVVPTIAAAAVPTAEAGAHLTDDSPTVCIDVGHGGVDEGKLLLSDDGTEILAQEKDFTLAQALELRDRLEAQGVQVVLTRDADTEVNATFEDVNSDGKVANDDNGDGEIDTSQGELPDELDELQARVAI